MGDNAHSAYLPSMGLSWGGNAERFLEVPVAKPTARPILRYLYSGGKTESHLEVISAGGGVVRSLNHSMLMF
jgi:hypothetical protein